MTARVFTLNTGGRFDRIASDETAAVVVLDTTRLLVRTQEELGRARSALFHASAGPNRAASLAKLEAAYQHHLSEAAEAVLRRVEAPPEADARLELAPPPM